MQTVINWREYPKEKPPSNGWYTVMAKGHVGERKSDKALVGRESYRTTATEVYSAGWAQDHNLSSTRGITVTHFALPEDIVSTSSEPKGE